MKSLYATLGCVIFASGVLAQFLEPPPTTSDPQTIKECTFWHIAVAGDTCEKLSSDSALTVAQLTTWNPSLAKGCKFVTGNSYCIEKNYGIPDPVITTTAPKPPTTTGNGVATPTPVSEGMTKSCNKFHFVAKGDGCATITKNYGISFEQMLAWNPAIGGNCEMLQLGVNYCVGLIGGTPVTSKPPTITTPANGIVTPSPIPDNMTKNCNKFHLVAKGDGCATITKQYSISFEQMFAWNPAIGSNCEMLQLGVNYCVGLIGGTPVTSKPPTITTPANGIVTPSPIQDNMTKNCNKFHLVVKGDGCSSIGTKYRVSFAQLFSWNPSIGGGCETMVLGTHLCVGVIGGGTTTAPTTKATTTSKGNGIATPTPIREGTTPNCTQFHLVVKGDTCASLGTKYGVTFAQLLAWNPTAGSGCDGLWLDTYVCVKATGGPTPPPTTTKKPVATTTTKGNGVTTPTPTQPGMVTNCKTFYKVVKGDGCQAVADKYKITLANFKKWNSGVGANCELMWLDAYVCVGLI